MKSTHQNPVRAVAALAAAMLLSGCMTLTEGTTQSVQVVSNPPGAACNVKRDGKEIARVQSTPASVTIEKSSAQIVVECTKDDSVSVQSFGSRDYTTIAGTVMGFVPYIGWVSGGIDSLTDADTKYPGVIQMDLHPSGRSLDSLKQVSVAEASSDVGKTAIGTADANPPQDDDTLFEESGRVDLGRYHALVIGIDDYKHLTKLRTSVHDATQVGRVLESDYGYAVQLLLNPTRDQIIEALDAYIERLGPSDNLLTYYAGHGSRDDATRCGYWLPVDATQERRSRWLSNSEIDDTLRALRVKHVMIVADSWYATALTRSSQVGLRDASYLNRIAQKRARVVLTSGGVAPISDTGGEGHSPFAAAFVQVLQGNTGLIDGTQVFVRVRRLVTAKTNETPQYSDIRNAGHDGGDFLFKRTSQAPAS